MQIVVIDLSAEENAQEIFETLNARGAQLTAADLIKNFVFQKLLENPVDVEKSYETYWRDFETAFWETEVSSGRIRYQRSSLFLNHWLISRTGEEVVAREVFSRFKTFAEHEVEVPMDRLLQQMCRAAAVYRGVTEAADKLEDRIDRIDLFAYRIKAMESDVMKSVLLSLLDPERPATPPAVINATLDVIESWLTRRMLVRATTKSYTQVVAELVNVIRQASVDQIDLAVRSYLISQRAEARYWPDDEELTLELNGVADLSKDQPGSSPDGSRGHRGPLTRVSAGWHRVRGDARSPEHVLDRAHHAPDLGNGLGTPDNGNASGPRPTYPHAGKPHIVDGKA